MKLTTLKGSFGNYKADEAWSSPLWNGSFDNYKADEAWKLTTLMGSFGEVETDDAWIWPLQRGSLVIINQKTHESDHCKGERC